MSEFSTRPIDEMCDDFRDLLTSFPELEYGKIVQAVSMYRDATVQIVRQMFGDEAAEKMYEEK